MSNLPLSGFVTGVVKDAAKKPVYKFSGKNLVVAAGKVAWANVLINAGSTRILGAALGQSSTPAAANQTALGTELASSRVAITSVFAISESITYIFTWTGPVGGFSNIVEIGLFSSSVSGGTMFARFVTSLFQLEQGFDLDLAWTLKIG